MEPDDDTTNGNNSTITNNATTTNANTAFVFTVFDSFKASSMQPGTFVLSEHRTGWVAMTGTFEFEPHWRPTSVARHIDANVDGLLVQLEVKNSRGRAARFAFTCDSSR